MNTTTYSKTYRIIHWAIAIFILLTLVTIFLRLTWLNKYNVSDIIESYLSSQNIAINHDQSIMLAKQIRKPMWTWHIYFGYVLTALFSIRLLLPFFGSMKFQNPFSKGLTTKLRFQKLTYVIFYLGLTISLLTGLMMEFGPKDLAGKAEGIHILSLYYLIPFLVIHFGGVIIAEFTNQKGIIYSILRGSNDN